MTLSETFLGLRIHRKDHGVEAMLETLSLAQIAAGEVVIRVHYSSINYKDALAATGRGAIVKRFPLVGGIDLAGEVVESSDSGVTVGDIVLVCGCGLGETHDGGYAEFARVPADWVVRVPQGLDTRSAMAIGTAGFTAALAIARLEHNDVTPELGPLVITGASGGVGSLAVDMAAGRGYDVVALTGKTELSEFLEELGARQVIDRKALQFGRKPLEKARFGGGIDTLGGDVLAWLLKCSAAGGGVASIGLAASAELKTTVLPFILRGVSLFGVNSVNVPAEHREAIWNRLASDLRPQHLDSIVSAEVPLKGLLDQFDAFIQGTVSGRTVVRIARDVD